MITVLAARYQKRIACLLFLIFYGELAITIHAAKKYDARELLLNSSATYHVPVFSPVISSPFRPVKMPSLDKNKNQPSKKAFGNNLAKADIGGPGQPEMSTFKSVGSDNMVNLFTGDFSYNIPLLDVGGYPINIFYNAGANMDQEASWTGLGWNINPGTINRNMRGLPDDYNGVDKITKTQSMKPDLTVGVTGTLGIELAGVPGLSADISAGIFYNNRRGLGLEAGLKGEYSPQKMLAQKGRDEKTLMDTVSSVSISGGIKLNSQQGMSLNSGFSLYRYSKEKEVGAGLGTSVNYSSRQGLTDLSIDAEIKKYKQADVSAKDKRTSPIRDYSLTSSDISFARSSFTPSIRMPLTNFNQFYAVKFGGEATVLFWNATVGGYVQESRIDKKDQTQVKPAYGYMYYEQAEKDKNAMMDFNRLNDGIYTLKTPVISVPVYTYDVFTINGEGTGGSFRGYRGNPGFVRDNTTRSRNGSLSLTLDLGSGAIVHGGTLIGGVYSPSEVSDWKNNNLLRNPISFKANQGIKQGFYFRNPGEKAIIDEDYYNHMGGDKLIRPYLLNTGDVTPMLASGYQVFNADKKVESDAALSSVTALRNQRDKRSQVISYLTAEDADKAGLDKKIYSYTENQFMPGCSSPYKTAISRFDPNDPTVYRKKHHLSEIDVLETDGKRYVYGIPVYQIKQQEVTFGTEKTPDDKRLITTGEDNADGAKGKDNFFQKEQMDGYASSFLLTGILSPDYVDVKGDGITDDDLGTAVKFNYSRVYKGPNILGKNSWYPFKWRMPAYPSSASFNEGLKTDNSDDKGLYTYGEKELWYLHSVESKNMVAAFRVSDRDDGCQATNEDGTDIPFFNRKQKKLDRIDLYTKADFLKNGANAKPVKTVHFEYSYKLCPAYILNKNANGGDRGKLTLNALWFTYNGNEKQVKNKYVFSYSTQNPSYNSAETDRWGNYKPHSANPNSGVPNNDYSYSIQNTDLANSYASAWNLEKILLPGGGVINVQYEADDYAFVQDRRACQMIKIAGFGMTNSSTPTNKLYTFNAAQANSPGDMDHRFVFFDLTSPLATKEDINVKYLQGFKQLLLKLWVKVPTDQYGGGYEPIVIYSPIKDYGFAKNSDGTDNHNRFYIELLETDKDGSPVMQTVMQFLKDHLPSKAFPGYDLKGENGFVQLIRASYGMMRAFSQGVLGFERDLKGHGTCKEVLLNMSFARLDNPDFKKIGGGYRVKQIKIEDNWDKMTKKNDAQGLPASYYGQIYDYTTTEEVNGQKMQISSGVASYEPGVGNEENPFREVLQYTQKQFLGPTDYSNIELPFAETFYPSPGIGYSKVTVKSIHSKETHDNKTLKSGIGSQVTEFYTTRDFPVTDDFTSFDNDSRHHHKPGLLNKIFNFNKKDYVTLTQGFRVVLNDMNGKMKSQTSFPENDLATPINHTEWHYRLKTKGSDKFELDNVVPVINGPDGKISSKLIGKDVEVMNDLRQHFSYTYSAQIPINAEFFTVGPIPVFIPTIFRMPFRDEARFRSATTLKVVNEYGILDSVVNIDKGSVVGTKNMVYDAETGEVLVSRTNNEFNKPVYQFSYPAWWTNTGMEPAYRNIDLTYSGVFFRNGRIESGNVDNFDYFESGDEIYVVDNSKDKSGVPENPGCIAGGYPATIPTSNESIIWAIDTRKDSRNTQKEFIFIDRNGNPYNSANATIRVIRSGKRNFTSASVGNIVSMVNPVQTVGTDDELVINNSTNVISAGAVEFKERWRASDQFYTENTTITTVRQAPVHSTNVYTVNSYSKGIYRPPGTFFNRAPSARTEFYPRPNYFMARQFDEALGRGGTGHSDAEQKSWLLFDFSAAGVNADFKVVSAKLSLGAHIQQHDFNVGGKNGGNHSALQPHVSTPDHRNDFYLSRVFGNWPTDNDHASWDKLYTSDPTGMLNQKYVLGTPPNYSSLDYVGNKTIDVTNLVTGMLSDKFNSSKNYATALKLSLASPKSRQEARVCFAAICQSQQSSSARSIKGGGDGIYCYNPLISLDYIVCSEAFGLPGNPSAPSPGQRTADCISQETGTFCFSVFSKKQMNPYIEGVLGNWRPLRSYVYYGERRETDPTTGTDLGKNGIIKDFEPYWAFSTTALTKTNSIKWTWNSEITQYNRKGAELENHDPLDRFNSGIYGYQDALPVAVINNSRLRLSAFDGFEDYYYQDNSCEPSCRPYKRHFNAGIETTMLNDQESHSGRYSLQINANQNHLLDIPVSTIDNNYDPDTRIKVDKTANQQVTLVTPRGIGLKGFYYSSTSFEGDAVTRIDPTVNLSFESHSYDNNCTERKADDPPAAVLCNGISVRWLGKLQVETTGNYQFDIPKADDAGYLYIDGNLVASTVLGGAHTKGTVNLSAGTLHDIRVDYQQTIPVQGYIQLFWTKPGGRSEPIASRYLYPQGQESLANGTVQTQTVYCDKPDTIQAIAHHLIDSFNLVSSQSMVASVWIKKGGQDCKCTGYNDIMIRVKDANGNQLSEGGLLVPKERIIEGWQLFESVFTVPVTGNKISLEFNAPSSVPLYIDDLRLHPFNANMKSFVYDPVTLRLAAELDENNFAAFYEYDDDGTLVRVKKETREGIKTISETRSAVQKKIDSLD